MLCVKYCNNEENCNFGQLMKRNFDKIMRPQNKRKKEVYMHLLKCTKFFSYEYFKKLRNLSFYAVDEMTSTKMTRHQVFLPQKNRKTEQTSFLCNEMLALKM
jgi:hypothetical protein